MHILLVYFLFIVKKFKFYWTFICSDLRRHLFCDLPDCFFLGSYQYSFFVYFCIILACLLQWCDNWLLALLRIFFFLLSTALLSSASSFLLLQISASLFWSLLLLWDNGRHSLSLIVVYRPGLVRVCRLLLGLHPLVFLFLCVHDICYMPQTVRCKVSFYQSEA